MLGLGASISKNKKLKKPIVKDNLVLKHNYMRGGVNQVSTGAAFFNGTSDKISIGTIAGTTGHKSITAWIYHDGSRTLADSSNNQGAILTFGDVMFELTTATEITSWNDVDRATADADTPTALNIWRHIAVTMEVSGSNTIHKTYVDGVLIDTTTVSSSVPDDGSRVSTIGTYGSRYFPGYICNVGFWSGKVLTQAEIKSIMWKKYADLTSAETTSLVSWWNLDSTMITPVDSDSDGVTQLGTLDSHYGGGSELGSEMWDGANGSHTNWTNFGGGNTTVTTSDGAVKITYVDHADGRYIYLKNAHDLNADLVVGKFYRLTFSTKINDANGSVEWKIKEEGEDSYHAGALTSTSFVTQQIDFIATSTTDHYLYPSSMDGIEAVWIKDVSLKLINGNHGTLS